MRTSKNRLGLPESANQTVLNLALLLILMKAGGWFTLFDNRCRSARMQPGVGARLVSCHSRLN